MNLNKQKGLIVLSFVFFCLIMNVNASTKYVVLLDGVNIRSGPGTNYSVKITGSVGSTYYLKSEEIISDASNNSDCSSGWYEINYNNESAYVCSNYARVASEEGNATPTTACEIEMQNAGFPSSYWQGLCSLKTKHPNWTFKALNTNLEWSTAVAKESSCGQSKIITSNKEFIDNTCYANEGAFRAASQKAVAFYMDPRNFLTENYIFQFEYLKYENSLAEAYTSAINKMLAPTAFYKFHVNNNVDFAALTNTAGKEMDINPISLAARMYQELGVSTSLYNLYSGNHGYYNFYNIGVNSSCVNDITTCGINMAKKNEWDTPYKGIKGGASFLANSYLAKGQFTSYLQKFNVAPYDKKTLYLNQYMTNIAAPSSESQTTYKTYSNMDLLNSAFAFYIPIYMNMNTTITNSDNGITNDPGSLATPSTTSINSIISTSGYKLSGEYLSGIEPNSSIESVLGNIEAIAGAGNVSITNNENNPVSKVNIGTGFKVTVKNNVDTKTFKVVIKGDTSGDGTINALDLLQVQKNILGTYKLTDEFKLAGDTSGDGAINALDLLQVQKSILGTYKVEQ